MSLTTTAYTFGTIYRTAGTLLAPKKVAVLAIMYEGKMYTQIPSDMTAEAACAMLDNMNECEALAIAAGQAQA
jgi:hypothetical protein